MTQQRDLSQLFKVRLTQSKTLGSTFDDVHKKYRSFDQ